LTQEPKREPKSSWPSEEDAGTRGIAPSAGNQYGVFEKAAIERLRLNSETTRQATFLPLPVKVTALAAVGIAFTGLVWSFVAKIPVQVNAIAAIIPEAGIRSLYAPTDGSLRYQISGIGQLTLDPLSLQTNRLIRQFWDNRYNTSSWKLQNEAALSRLGNLALRSNPGQDLVLYSESQFFVGRNRSAAALSYPKATVVANIVNASNYQEFNDVLLTSVPKASLALSIEGERKRVAEVYKTLSTLTKEQQQTISRELTNRIDLHRRYEALWKTGAIASTVVLEEEGTINRLREALLQNKIAEATTEINRREQFTQSKQAQITNIESRSTLEVGLIRFLERSIVFAPPGGFYILSSYAANNSTVKQGDEILSYTHKPPELPRIVPVFLDGTTAQQLSPGMKVLLTPKGVSRAQFGGIPGVVTEVNRLPLLGDSLLAIIGSRGMAASVTDQYKTPYRAYVKLEIADSKSCQQALSLGCYRWSSGRIPSHGVRLATLADVQITTDYRRPIEFVMPSLRRSIGLVVDNR
jgi:hypothetical protein